MQKTSQHEDRVKHATPSSLNEKIENETWQRVGEYMQKSRAAISERITALEKEWDIERYLGVNMSTLAFTGLATAAITKNKQWNILPAIVLAFFFQHSVQGWCPPLPVLRMLKLRTSKEIEQEKYALKYLRGDFDDLANVAPAEMQRLKQAITKN